MTSILNKQEIKTQTRSLWKKCFPEDSEEFLDLYFEDKYTSHNNFTYKNGAEIIGAMQMLPYRMNFYNTIVHTGYVSGLCVAPDFRKNGIASTLLREAHRKLYEEGGVFSCLIPGNDALRSFYEKPQHGAYWSTAFRAEVTLQENNADFPPGIKLEEPEEWTEDLFVFYHKETYRCANMIQLKENDFYSALDTCDIEGGHIVTARKGKRLVGLCWAVQEKDGRFFMRDIIAINSSIESALILKMKKLFNTQSLHMKAAVPGGTEASIPYGMFRVINVLKFFKTILLEYPSFELHIGVDGDLDIPENNAYYYIKEGQILLTEERPETILTPGGLAAMFLASYPIIMRNLLDE